jgi:hypothetical protein
MKQITFILTLIIPIVTILNAQMYDPFAKTAKPKLTSLSNGLLPPLPMMKLPPIIPPPTVVSAVMNEKAFINGQWYQIGDKVNNKEITYIQKNFVGLREGNTLTMISVGANRRLLGTKDIQ